VEVSFCLNPLAELFCSAGESLVWLKGDAEEVREGIDGELGDGGGGVYDRELFMLQ
jgi:hypothetical protein